MKRISEKIKDLVDVRDYETVNNFGGDSESTVVAYHFTDATAELMAKWLDEIVELAHRETGAARALAGNRGVGKSHFIGVFGSLASHPELRNRLADSHVVASAKRLPRSKHSVVRVERGTAPNLIEELRNALNTTFAEVSHWGDNVRQMLITAAARNEDLPLVVLIDSAFDRLNRVKREDGALLGEMAETARISKIFLAVALDDDIAGADGVNAAITRTFTIDFLDQEHLYRVVDSYLFQKRPVARAKLHDLYLNLREISPGFNWSEPRFNALYPIHPVVVDVTPSVRLYAPKFAFLPFAAESSSKVMSRPAHSLIALDEVFDRVENELRKADELSEAFATYDDLALNAVPLIPVMQRLQAKLVLKGLLMFSLDGRGATARELGAAMLITDESQPEAAVTRIEEMIAHFATVAASDKLHRFTDGNENRFSLGGGIGATFETKLTEAAQSVEPEIIGRVMRRVGQARFSDWVFNDLNVTNSENVAEFAIQWRGSPRRGRIAWQWENENGNTPNDYQDWQIFIRYSNENIENIAVEVVESDKSNALVIEWKPAILRRDEEEAVRRYAALLTAPELTSEFGETAAAAEQTASALVERIWTRIFLDEGKLVINNVSQSFDENAKSAPVLSETLAHALAPNFAELFPSHPNFAQLLTFNEVSQIVSELFGAADATSPTTQNLAQTFALPLGLVVPRGANLVLETDENLLKLPLLQSVWKFVESAEGEVVSINEIAQILKSAPFGLQREAQNLILAALVARRRLEFVTGRNERIGRRSLDLKIIWADIKGVAQSATLPRSSAELANWAKLLTGKNGFASTDEPSEALRIRESLQSWRVEWNETRILPKFEELPDEILNLRAWRLASHTERTFGAAAEAVEAILADEITLEEGLERVIDAFGDAPEQILSNQRELVELQNFVGAADSREATRRYLALAEATNDETIEHLRDELLNVLNDLNTAFDAEQNQEFERDYQAFQHRFSEFYIRRHDSFMHTPLRVQMLEKIESSAEWTEFAGLSEIEAMPPQLWQTAKDLRDSIKRAVCVFDVRQVLREQPFCACGFRLSQMRKLEKLPQELARTMNNGRNAFRRTLSALGASLSSALTEIAATETNDDSANKIRGLAENLRQSKDLPLLSVLELRLLKQAAEKMSAPTIRIRTPKNFGTGSREDLREKFNGWLDQLPNAPVSVKMADDE